MRNPHFHIVRAFSFPNKTHLGCARDPCRILQINGEPDVGARAATAKAQMVRRALHEA